MRVAWRVHGADGGTFNAKDLAIRNAFLVSTRRIFVDCVGEVRIEAKKVGDSASVITVPVA